MSTALILQKEKSTLPFFVFSKKIIDWIPKVALYHMKNDFHEVHLNSNKSIRQVFFISVSSFFLFVKWILLEDLYAVNIIYEPFYKRIELKLLNLFDFTDKNQWNPQLFNLDHFLAKISKNNDDSYQKLDSPHFHLPKNIGRDEFQFKDFYRDLNLISRLKEINSNIENNKQQFLVKLRDLYHSKPLQIQHLMEGLNLTNEQELHFGEAFCSDIALNPVLSSQKRIILIFNQPDADLSPFLFLKDSLLRGFFHISLVNAQVFGGRYDAILILEYIKDISSLENENSEWNRLIRNVRNTYPHLEIKLYEISIEERFLNTDTFFPVDWRNSEYLDFSLFNKMSEKSDVLEKIRFSFETVTVTEKHRQFLDKYLCIQELTEVETNLLFKSKIFYYKTHFSWKFWQITGYSFSCVLIVENPEEGKKKNKLINLLYQLPIGTILYLNDGSKISSKLCCYLQFRDNITDIWYKLVSFLELMKLNYVISPILPLCVYHSSIFSELLNIAKKPLEFRFKKGEIIELPLFPLRMRLETYTPTEQIHLYQTLKEKYPTGQTNLTHSRWISILRDYKELKEKTLITYESVKKIIG